MPRVGLGGAEPRPRRICRRRNGVERSAARREGLPRRRPNGRGRGRSLEDHQTTAEYRRDLVRAVVATRLGAVPQNKRALHQGHRAEMGRPRPSGGSKTRRWSPAKATSLPICPPRIGCVSSAARTPRARSKDQSAAMARRSLPPPILPASSRSRRCYTSSTTGQSAQPMLADGVVRFVGEPVAAVVASSADEAEDVAELVEVAIGETRR